MLRFRMRARKNSVTARPHTVDSLSVRKSRLDISSLPSNSPTTNTHFMTQQTYKTYVRTKPWTADFFTNCKYWVAALIGNCYNGAWPEPKLGLLLEQSGEKYRILGAANSAV